MIDEKNPQGTEEQAEVKESITFVNKDEGLLDDAPVYTNTASNNNNVNGEKKVENLLEMEEPQNNSKEKVKNSDSLLDLDEPAEKKYTTSVHMQPQEQLYSTQAHNPKSEMNFFEPPQN